MPVRNVILRIVCGAGAVTMLLVAPSWGQVRDAASKINGSAYRGLTSFTYAQAAYNHAKVLDEYARGYTYIPAETLKEHTDEIRRNLTAAQGELAKSSASAKKDKTLAKHVETLTKHYENALAHATTLETAGAKESKSDSKQVGESAAAMTKSLKAADAEHKRLLKHLGGEKSENPKKEKAGKQGKEA